MSRARSTRRGAFRDLLREPKLVLWTLYLLLIPVYLFPSGLPQPGDLFIILLVPVVLLGWNGKLPRISREAFRPLMWFTVWVVLVDFTWAIVSGNYGIYGVDTYLIWPLYYIYNLFIFLTALVLCRDYGERFLRLTVSIVRVSVYLLVIVSLVFRSNAYRQTVLFNNPNQLGYYALLAATLIAIMHLRLKLRLLASAGTLTCCTYLALISGSRAAAGGVALLLVFMIFANPRVIIVASLAAIGLVFVGGTMLDALAPSEERVLSSSNSQLSFLEGRAYDRIWIYKEYVVVGAGEGGLARFDEEQKKGMEIHSTAGTIIFSYGIVGSVLFLIFVWRVVRGAKRRLTLMLVAPMLYTIAHQGLRFTLLWVLIAVFIALKDKPASPRASPQPVGV